MPITFNVWPYVNGVDGIVELFEFELDYHSLSSEFGI